MVKEYDGAIAGRSATQFSYAYDDASNTGTYVATESFEGTVDGRAGTFAFVHSATTRGGARQLELFVVVPGSGTGGLAGITGTGVLHIGEDGTHQINLDYSIPELAQQRRSRGRSTGRPRSLRASHSGEADIHRVARFHPLKAPAHVPMRHRGLGSRTDVRASRSLPNPPPGTPPHHRVCLW
jgi:hypothetical protein